MHSETNTPVKEMVELDMTVATEQQTSFLEEDLAISSSAHDSLADKTITEPEEKSREDETTCQSPIVAAPIYVSEDAMDCNYDESSSTIPCPKHFELPEAVPSPELFESDADDEAESTTSTFPTVAISQEPSQPTQPSPKRLTSAELVMRADRYVRRRVHKFLSGVPPPPNHTVCHRDCDDFLTDIKRNRRFFWADPFEGELPAKEANLSGSSEISTHSKAESTTTSTSTDEKKLFHPPRGSLRNLSTAFDACEQLSNSRLDNNESLIDYSDPGSSFSSLLNNSSFLSVSTLTLNEDSKLGDSGIQEQPPTSYMSTNVDNVVDLPFNEAFPHRCHDIYYNRNRFVEDFENLRVKLCDRYIGNETQSTCNVWFVKQAPNSARKRNLLFKRNNGQSPGKRLSYLAKRRRTFSSANLQGLGNVEKKQVVLNVRKIMTRKGKSPRGKSPRGKSPRGKTPRSSAKKRQLRNGTPRKRVEFPKRALFQSPPNDKPGPSRLSAPATVTSNNPAKIKKALFPTPKKNEAGDTSQSQSLSYPDSRKRKSDEELENPRQKWAKSLSFDCNATLDSSSNKWNPVRHSTGTVLSKDGTPNYGKCELSETHRKKLLWAVAEALRGKGIGMSHPQFKQYAATLGRTVRKYMPDLENKNVPRKPGSTTDRMLKLAKRHAILIVESKTAH